MKRFVLAKEGEIALRRVKSLSRFPYKQGILRNSVLGRLVDPQTYCITFNANGEAPYVTYLQEGTAPHNIPRAFGRPLPFGTSGRFKGKFHPGSMKHKGFIDRAVQKILDRYIVRYGAVGDVYVGYHGMADDGEYVYNPIALRYKARGKKRGQMINAPFYLTPTGKPQTMAALRKQKLVPRGYLVNSNWLRGVITDE